MKMVSVVLALCCWTAAQVALSAGALFDELRLAIAIPGTENGSTQSVLGIGRRPAIRTARSAMIEIQNSEGKPVTNATIRVQFRQGFNSQPVRNQTTDIHGKSAVELPANFSHLELAVSAPGYGVERRRIPVNEIEDEIALELEKGDEVRGTVQNEESKPIRGARVTIFGVANPWTGNLKEELGQAMTSADGKWSSSVIPKRIYKLAFEIKHPDFLAAEFSEAKPPLAGASFVNRSDLDSGRAIFVLKSGVRLEGLIKDDDGRPAKNAELRLILPPIAREQLQVLPGHEPPVRELSASSDAAGRFLFPKLAPGTGILTIDANERAPITKTVELKPGIAPLEFILNRGVTYSGRIIDGTNPVAHVTVRTAEPGRPPRPSTKTETDQDGRFSWPHGPEGQMQFALSKQGYHALTVTIPPSEAFPTIRLSRELRLAGKVLDAETGKPIPMFELINGSVWNPFDTDEDGIQWEFWRPTRGTAGAYSLLLPFGPATHKLRVMARADGYLPAATPLFAAPDLPEFDFKLVKGKGISSTVFGPGHEPVEGADIAILGTGNFNLGKGVLRGGSEFMTKTDAQGRFQLPGFLASSHLLAVHPAGFAKVDVGLVNLVHEIELEPWSRVEGIFKNGTRPAAHEMLMFTGVGIGPTWLQYDQTFKVITDEMGRFAFDHVPPGSSRLVHLVPAGQGSQGDCPETIEVPAGSTVQIVYGGVGCPVIGKFVLEDPKEQVDWNATYHSVSTKMPQPSTPFRSPVEVEKWNERPEIRKAQPEIQSHAFPIETDGSFRVENVRPGAYLLTLHLPEFAPAVRLAPPRGIFQKELIVPHIPGGVADVPLNLGELKVKLNRDSKVQ